MEKGNDHRFQPLLFRDLARVEIDMLEHEITQLLHGFGAVGAHPHLRPAIAFAHDIAHHRIDAAAVRIAQHGEQTRRQLGKLQVAAADRIVDIMVEIGDAVAEAHYAALQRLRLLRPAVAEDAVARFLRQVQPLAIVFQQVHHAQPLAVMVEIMLYRSKRPFAGMAERRMPQVMTKRDRLGQVFVQAERAGNGTGDLRHLQRMRQARAEMVAAGIDEDLRLMFQPAEGLAVDDAVAVMLPDRAQAVRRFRPLPAAAGMAVRGPGCKKLILPGCPVCGQSRRPLSLPRMPFAAAVRFGLRCSAVRPFLPAILS